MLMSALIFVLAPLPNALFAHCGGDDFTTDYEGSGPVDLGRFLTSTVVVTGFALPLVLAHSEIIRPGACAMSIIGGSCVIASLASYTMWLTLPFADLYMAQSWRTVPLSSKKIQITIEPSMTCDCFAILDLRACCTSLILIPLQCFLSQISCECYPVCSQNLWTAGYKLPSSLGIRRWLRYPLQV